MKNIMHLSSRFSPVEFLKRHHVITGTVLSDLFLLWVILRFELGGWERGARYFSQGLTLWGFVIVCIVFFTLYKSDFRTDVPLFLSAFVLGYWLEWWGTTRGVWTYASKETPPVGVVFFWGICLVAVYHFHLVFRRRRQKGQEKVLTWPKMLVLGAVLGIAVVFAWKGFAQLDRTKHFDVHSIVAIIVGGLLILKGFDPIETLWIFLIGAGLGGLLESLATEAGTYRYVTGQGIPLFVAPFWGMTCVVMVKLAYLIRDGVQRGLSLVGSRRPRRMPSSPDP